MGERLLIEIDVATAESAVAAQQVAQAIGQVGQASKDADQQVTKVEKGLQGLGSAAGSTAGELQKAKAAAEQAGQATAKMADETQKAASAEEAAAEQTLELARCLEVAEGRASGAASGTMALAGSLRSAASAEEITVEQTLALAESLELAGGAYKGLATAAETNVAAAVSVTKDANELTGEKAPKSVGLWAGSYLALMESIKIIDLVKQHTEAAINAQERLVQKKFDQGDLVKNTMRDLNLEGLAGEGVARGLLHEVLDAAPASPQQASLALRAANSGGFDPRTPQGMDVAKELANAIPRLDLDEQAVTQLARGVHQQGIGDAQGLKKFLAQVQKVYGASLGLDPATFLRGLVSATGPELAKGANLEYAIAAYSGLVSESRNERDAANAVRQVYSMAQGTNAKTRSFFAHKAAESGVTNVAPVGDQEFEAIVNGRKTKEAKEVFKERAAIGVEVQAAEMEEQKYQAAEGPRRRGKESADQRAARDEAHRVATERRREQLEQRRLKLKDDEEKLRKAEQSRREQAAYQAIGLQERVERVVVPTFQEAKTDEQRNVLTEGLGSIAQGDAVFRFSNSTVQQQTKLARALAVGAKSTDTDRANKAYEETSPAKNTRNQSEIDMSEAGSVEKGEEYEARFRKQAESDADILRKNSSTVDRMMPGVGDAESLTSGTINLTDASYTEFVVARKLYDEMLQFWNALTPKEQKENPEIRELIWKTYKEKLPESPGAGFRFAWQQKDVNRGAANDFGKRRAKVQEQRYLRGNHDLDKVSGSADVTTPYGTGKFDLAGSAFDPGSGASSGEITMVGPDGKTHVMKKDGRRWDQDGNPLPPKPTAAQGPQASATIINNHYSYNPGQVFASHGEDVFDLPGTLDRYT